MRVVLAIVPWVYAVDMKFFLILTLHVPFHLFSHVSIHSLIHSFILSLKYSLSICWLLAAVQRHQEHQMSNIIGETDV